MIEATNPRDRFGMKWTSDEIELLLQLRELGKTWDELAKVFGRSPEAIEAAHKRQVARRRAARLRRS